MNPSGSMQCVDKCVCVCQGIVQYTVERVADATDTHSICAYDSCSVGREARRDGDCDHTTTSHSHSGS